MSVRTRLVVAFATILVVVVVTGAVVAATQRGYLLEQVDSQLRAAIAPIVRVSSLGPRPTHSSRRRGPARDPTPEELAVLVRHLGWNRRVPTVASSDSPRPA